MDIGGSVVPLRLTWQSTLWEPSRDSDVPSLASVLWSITPDDSAPSRRVDSEVVGTDPYEYAFSSKPSKLSFWEAPHVPFWAVLRKSLGTKVPAAGRVGGIEGDGREVYRLLRCQICHALQPCRDVLATLASILTRSPEMDLCLPYVAIHEQIAFVNARTAFSGSRNHGIISRLANFRHQRVYRSCRRRHD